MPCRSTEALLKERCGFALEMFECMHACSIYFWQGAWKWTLCSFHSSKDVFIHPKSDSILQGILTRICIYSGGECSTYVRPKNFLDFRTFMQGEFQKGFAGSETGLKVKRKLRV